MSCILHDGECCIRPMFGGVKRRFLDVQRRLCVCGNDSYSRGMQFNDDERWLELESGSGIWSYNKPNLASFPMRMLAIRLKDQSLLVYSPAPDPKPECFEQLDALGDVKYLVEPNHYHNLALKSYKERYPNAQLLAAPQALPRLAKVTKLEIKNLEGISSLLPAHLEFVEPEGMKAGEIWIVARLKSGTAWILCDAFFNMSKVPRNLFGFILRLGGTAPGLRQSRVFRMIGLKDKVQYAKWLRARIEADKPVLLIPSHGDILYANDLAERLMKLA